MQFLRYINRYAILGTKNPFFLISLVKYISLNLY